MTLPGRAWRIIHYSQNFWWDARATLAGYCNHCPNDGTPGTGGGYTFWRCALRRGHDGLHRSRNYVWTDDGVASYLPTKPTQPMPDQPWSRTVGITRRQRRNRNAWHRQKDTERKASRR